MLRRAQQSRYTGLGWCRMLAGRSAHRALPIAGCELPGHLVDHLLWVLCIEAPFAGSAHVGRSLLCPGSAPPLPSLGRQRESRAGSQRAEEQRQNASCSPSPPGTPRDGTMAPLATLFATTVARYAVPAGRGSASDRFALRRHVISTHLLATSHDRRGCESLYSEHFPPRGSSVWRVGES